MTTIANLLTRLPPRGVEARVIAPSDFLRRPLPWYPGIEIALPTRRAIGEAFDQFEPDAVHIFTEATIGWAVRHECLAGGLPFTTSYHTRYPEYLKAWLGIPVGLSYSVLRRFHNGGNGCMVATASMRTALVSRAFRGVRA